MSKLQSSNPGWTPLLWLSRLLLFSSVFLKEFSREASFSVKLVKHESVVQLNDTNSLSSSRNSTKIIDKIHQICGPSKSLSTKALLRVRICFNSGVLFTGRAVTVVRILSRLTSSSNRSRQARMCVASWVSGNSDRTR